MNDSRQDILIQRHSFKNLGATQLRIKHDAMGRSKQPVNIRAGSWVQSHDVSPSARPNILGPDSI